METNEKDEEIKNEDNTASENESSTKSSEEEKKPSEEPKNDENKGNEEENENDRAIFEEMKAKIAELDKVNISLSKRIDILEERIIEISSGNKKNESSESIRSIDTAIG